jgi:hypothetical protein
MKRCFCFLVLLAAVFLAGPQGTSVLIAADLDDAEAPTRTAPQIVEEQPAPTQMDAERNDRDDRKTRKGIGADFWGGPYWGYGPRWGHPCEVCRATCESDQEGSRCERCRVRCGW